MKIHITKQGESLDDIANNYSVSRQDLAGINPHVNLTTELVPGLKLKIPVANRTVKNEHIEQFFPNLEHDEAVPIGLKPFTPQPEMKNEMPVTAVEKHLEQPHIPGANYEPEPVSPWSHLASQPTNLSNPSGYHAWNSPYSGFAAQPDTRAIIPPMPYYPPYPYPSPYYGYPPYGYGMPLPVPIPVPGFGYGGGFGHGGGFHGGGHGGGHRYEYNGQQTTSSS